MNRIATLIFAAPVALLVGGHSPSGDGYEPSLEALHSLVDAYAHAIETNTFEISVGPGGSGGSVS